MEFIETPRVKEVKTKTLKKEQYIMTAKDTYKQVKSDHNAEIKKLRIAIKKHKLLKKQAKNIYKLSKLSTK